MRLDANARAPDEIPVWDGSPFDVVYAIDVLYAPADVGGVFSRSDHPSRERAG
jgi:hypothetical protein